jgi:uncharacterized protein involved in exopolysaccharide biosynthesis
MADLRFYLSRLLKRSHYVLFFLLVGSAIGLTLAAILPSTYRATAQLVVESEQIPDELAASTVRTNAREQLQIIQQRILTRANLLEMAERFDVYADPGEAALRPDEIVRDMRQRISIATAGGPRRRGQTEATLVDIRFTAADPDLAAAIVNEVVTLIVAEDVRIRTGVSGETLDFFQQEADRLDRELAARSAQIVAFQNENRGALPEDLDFRRRQLLLLQDRLTQLDRDEAALTDRRETLERIYEATGQLAAPTEAERPLTEDEVALRNLERDYANSIVVLSAENPRMRVLQTRIEALRETVARQRQDAAEQAGQEAASPGEPPASPFDLQIAEIERQQDAIGVERTSLREDIEEMQRSITETPANALALDTMTRDLSNIRRQYDEAIRNRARAETGDMIEALSKGQRISVIEQATPPNSPISPNREGLIAAGVGGGLAVGLGLVLLLELLNTSVRRPVDIARKLEIQPIGVLPYIQTPRELGLRRLKIGGAFALAAIVVPAGLWAVNAYVMPLDLLAENVLERLPIEVIRSAIDQTGGGA